MAQRRRPKRNPLLNPLAWYQENGELFPLVRTTPVTDPCRLSAAARGTYRVNPDCTGSSTIDIPGLPFSIETAFVIVNDGDEVQDAVMAPAPNLVTGVGKRIGR
jgi:hypothetical protein